MSGIDPIARTLARAALSGTALRSSLLIHNRPGLRAWHAALADREAAPAKVVWLGDSITEGWRAASYGQRWVDRALARLRLDHPTPGLASGGFNYLPAFNAGGAGGPGQPYTGITGTAVADNSRGLGGRTSIFATPGQGLTFTVSATSVAIHYVRGPITGTIAISIDGAAPVNVATVNAAVIHASWSSGPLTPGVHTVSITNGGGGDLYLSGLSVFDGDELKGIQGYEAGHYGWRASDANSLLQAPAWEHLTAIAPHLAVIAFGTNEFWALGAQQPIATYRAALTTLIANLRAQAPNISIALLLYGGRGDAGAQPIGWRAYVDAAYAVADADTGLGGSSGVAVIDLSRRLPDAAYTGAADPLALINADRVHYSAKGHKLIGEAVAGALRV